MSLISEFQTSAMCGSYISPEQSKIERAFHLSAPSRNLFSRQPDTRPTSTIPVIRHNSHAWELVPARWGFIPSWWSKPKPPSLTFNARCEEASVKPMWRQPWRSARCLIPAEGWYEWRDAVDEATGEVLMNPRTHTPLRKKYLVRPTHHEVIAFAGLYSDRSDKDDAEVSATIVTQASHGPVQWLHDRMPCVLPSEVWDTWLDPEHTKPEAVAQLLQSCREDFEAVAE